MATMVVDPTFIDTNVLVYANVASAPLHAVALQALKDLWTAGVELWLSRQIFREYLATLSRPQTYSAPQSSSTLVAQVQRFQTLMKIAEDGPAVTTRLLHLLGTVSVAGKQVHDANIVATMQAHGIPRLLTHNTLDFARFSSVIIVVPLVP
jgi:predicted nucleic acid-binding protein